MYSADTLICMYMRQNGVEFSWMYLCFRKLKEKEQDKIAASNAVAKFAGYLYICTTFGHVTYSCE